MKIINFNELLTKEHQESYENTKMCYICIAKFQEKHAKDKKYRKVWDHCCYTGEYRGTAHSICSSIWWILLWIYQFIIASGRV